MSSYVEAYLGRLQGGAARTGRELAPISDRNRAVRLVESDARSVESGFAAGVLTVEDGNRVRTLDPRQGTARLVEGDPAHLCWERLPQLAAYVDLLGAGFPPGALRFETPESELRLDLAAVDDDGRVLVLGEAKAEPLQLAKLEALVQTFEGDPGARSCATRDGDAHRLAHRLWATRAPYLWLVAAGARRAFRVHYGRTLRLTAQEALPHAADLWPYGCDGATPAVALPGSEAMTA
ncbi:hypothetical protein [Nocardioides sp. TF02-7]|uniref:hypothetical protein n=1 Tax=Nocardioides sp. TF02-7 TaxID=2917724 RepID=UPI001F060CE5|nr:hypothetical protein [Nocardioides sp. TF02-7]UMG91673.1 hypothetical protein MF408_16510 [Nocardioides sp. TF02-7]